MQRRHFLIASSALLCAPAAIIASRELRVTEKQGSDFSPIISAASDSSGNRIGVWQADSWQYSQPIQHRGHDSFFHRQRQELLFFSRRPGRELYVVDAQNGSVLHAIQSEDGYHYYGHGCVSADGRYLYTTENNIHDDGAGCIGVYDCEQNYRCIGHMDCEGIGPHDLALMPDGDTLVIAIGGIKTLPSRGRTTLNPDSLAPALHYLDLSCQRVIEKVPAPHFQLSLRHLDVSPDGSVLVGAQFQGKLPSDKPLVYLHRRGQALYAMNTAELALHFQRDYIASVSIDDHGKWAVTSCPRDNMVCLWNMQSQSLAQVWTVRDCAGAVYDAAYQQFILSNGDGQLLALVPGKRTLTQLAYSVGTHWDNHLTLRV
ncbi:DUF1513 domain-containing protein [uncultured Zhongshania sp.]|uniref:DUF1513 domain-containing protein n=1 Tax=uncultured Zhongshania sp. TaxID=1642288 RepID=UPI0025F13AFB|nr:DUF1513 domain-containing protein [uncultured Zhongshania sp.]